MDTRESNFLEEAIQALKNNDANAFRGAVTKLKQYCDIDKLRTNVFFKIITKMDKTGTAEDEEYNPY